MRAPDQPHSAPVAPTVHRPGGSELVTADGRVWTQGEWRAYLDGFATGLVDGIERGRKQMDDELATIQRTAAEVVHHMASVPARDHEADREAAARREARWAR